MLLVLCVTEITSWGALYYAFPVLAPSIAADTGWSVPAVTAAFSAGLLVSAAVGIPVGRLLDRHGPRWVMTAGSVVAVPATLLIATAGSYPAFVAAWLLAGVAQAATLYPPAFAALTRWWGADRVRALTGLTLVAGLASTVFAPLAAALLEPFGWRGTYLVLAGILAVVCIPAHLFGLRGPWPDPVADPVPHGSTTRLVDDDPARILRSRHFVLTTVTVTLGAFTSFAVAVNQVPLLLDRGLSTGLAAWALGLGGIGQLLGRLGYGPLAGHSTVRGRACGIMAALAVTTLLLAALPGPAGALLAAALLAGAARGMFTLLQATALSDRWHPRVYGRLNGIASAPVMVAVAISPWAGAALAGPLGGYPQVFVLLGVAALLAAGLALGTVPRR
ncbi:putative transporter, MFS family protein [Pseudonocardia saturnea]|uniref:Transporter, MFS family protein n=1 Tax=Pseudonocardia saturnea TaxID=33909 RepID=A0ABQ0S2U1_9PSEU|nr:putative transporter, MFS family protein [Pseudonocardia autotrophica]GEC27229.1 putative transporter, MFS family protein [Pseudonocardia saturnea]